MREKPPNKNTLPLYCAVTGIEMTDEFFSLGLGVGLRKGVFEVFSSPMLAFAEASPGSHTPGPWVAVQGGFHFKSRVQLEISDLANFDGLLPSQIASLVGALLRLRFESPVRLPVLANVPLADLPGKRAGMALAFEASPHQLGLFRQSRVTAQQEDLEWIAETLPVAAKFLHDDRFIRCFSVFDDCIWSGHLERSIVLMWTAVEILFDLSAAQHKSKAISSALADYIAFGHQDRDRAYGVIRDLYAKRGGVVHAGREVTEDDFVQSFALVRAMFTNVLNRRALPPKRTMH
jgi:hypothetical protein